MKLPDTDDPYVLLDVRPGATAEQMGARCHWCRHVLTVNEQIPNGAVPDAVLPTASKLTFAAFIERAGPQRRLAEA